MFLSGVAVPPPSINIGSNCPQPDRGARGGTSCTMPLPSSSAVSIICYYGRVNGRLCQIFCHINCRYLRQYTRSVLSILMHIALYFGTYTAVIALYIHHYEYYTPQNSGNGSRMVVISHSIGAHRSGFVAHLYLATGGKKESCL